MLFDYEMVTMSEIYCVWNFLKTTFIYQKLIPILVLKFYQMVTLNIFREGLRD